MRYVGESSFLKNQTVVVVSRNRAPTDFARREAGSRMPVSNCSNFGQSCR